MAEREIERWITVNGARVPIFNGESQKDAVNRAIAKENEKNKEQQIAKNQEERDRLNGKPTDVNFVANKMREQVENLTKASKDKSLSSIDKKNMLNDFKRFLDQNIQVRESSAPSGSHILNVTGNRAWYLNKSGTLTMLAPNGRWLKFNNDLSVTNDGKIDSEGRDRVRALAEKLHEKKGIK